MTRKQVGVRLRLIRKKLGLTQIEFSQRVGVTNASISAYELGDMWPSVEVLATYADIGGVTLDWLIIGVEQGLKHDEQKIVDLYRTLDEPRKKILVELAGYLSLIHEVPG